MATKRSKPAKKSSAAAPKTPARKKNSSGSRTAVQTPPRGTRRPSSGGSGNDRHNEASEHRREVIARRELEFWGVGLISLGLLLVLSSYLAMAGPAGDLIDTGLGLAVGLGRFALPPVLLGIGVALVRHQTVEHRFRLGFGWTLVVLSALGVLHLVNGGDGFASSTSDVSHAGGWLGALLAEPMRATISWAGAAVVLLTVATGGVMLITDTTIPDLMARLRGRVESLTEDFNSSPARTMHDPEIRVGGTVVRHGDDDLPASGGDGSFRDWALDERHDERHDKALDDRHPGGDRPAQVRPPKAPPVAPSSTSPSKPSSLPLGPAVSPSDWKLPSPSSLSRSETREVDTARISDRGRQLAEALASHGVETVLRGMTVGPTVTRFELELGAGVKVSRVTSLNRDIAYAMAATDVRILAPIPGKSAIGVEVPNESRQLVSLGDLLAAPEARAAVHPLDVAVGMDIAGRAVFLNLATTPHLLIAGATGAGKSSALNSIITSLLMRSTPEQVRLILIDPKQVEMGQYARLPHLLTAPVTNPKKAANALGWAVKEMERRYDLLVEAGYRDITGYNGAYDRGDLDPPDVEPEKAKKRMEYIVVVVDELNDLMMVAARDVEECITRIAQKARAVGIHLIVATQRPSVNVITGVIKANIPARIAFAVSSLTDSRVILDQPGAEKLVGRGDMLLLPGNSNVAQRVQGSWVDEDEVRRVVRHWQQQAPTVVYVPGIEGEDGAGGAAGSAFGGSDGDDDELFVRARDIIVRAGVGSTSLLQRKLKVGFARAGRLMDLLEERGVVGPSEGSKARTVLMSPEELDSLGE